MPRRSSARRRHAAGRSGGVVIPALVVALVAALSAVGYFVSGPSADATPKSAPAEKRASDRPNAKQPAAGNPQRARDAEKAATFAETDKVTAAHRAKKACGSCHETPSSHFSGPCTTCHSPKRPFEQPQLTHVQFGAHTKATQACASCHPPEPTSEIACRACHGNDCGKNAKTAADCVECHKAGSTSAWVPEK